MEFLNRHKKFFIIILVIICLIAAIATINYKFRPTVLDNAITFVISPIQEVSTNISSWFSDKISFISNMSDLDAENKRLEEEIAFLESENNRLKLVEQETENLSALLETREKYPHYPMVGAEVIASDASNWFDTFTIDKGTKDGLEKDMVVLSQGGLVGRISMANTTSSEVVSFLNIESGSGVSVKCLRTGEDGVIKGDVDQMQKGLCRMDYIDNDAQIMEGDVLVTSNLSDIYPPGITVGTVKEVHADSNGLNKYAVVEPAVDFKEMETVLVIDQVYDKANKDNVHMESESTETITGGE